MKATSVSSESIKGNLRLSFFALITGLVGQQGPSLWVIIMAVVCIIALVLPLDSDKYTGSVPRYLLLSINQKLLASFILGRHGCFFVIFINFSRNALIRVPLPNTVLNFKKVRKHFGGLLHWSVGGESTRMALKIVEDKLNCLLGEEWHALGVFKFPQGFLSMFLGRVCTGKCNFLLEMSQNQLNDSISI